MRIGKPRTPSPEPPDEDAQGEEQAAAALLLDDPARAAEARAEAEQLRTGASEARAKADADLYAARVEADRLIAATKEHGRGLTDQAGAAERRAADLEEHAQYVTHAHSVRQQENAARQHAADLTTEHVTLTEQVADLTARLAELAEQREDTTTGLATARETGDVPGLTLLRARLDAIDEIVGVTAGRRDAARQRANAIGEPGWGGELDQTLTAAAGYAKQHEELLDKIDPSRAQAGPDLPAVLDAIAAAYINQEPAAGNQTTTTVLLPHHQGA